MESGFGQNLEGFLIKGNLSLLQADIPALQGDGSIEGSGTLYINNIREYDVLNGVIIQDVLLQNQQITVPYTQPSFGPTTASFMIDGGVSIKATTNAISITSGGGLTIAGGASIAKNVNVGGVLDVNSNRITSVSWPLLGSDASNKDYVDSKTFGNILGNFTAGQVIIGDTGGNIIGYDSFKFEGGYLSVNVPIVINDTTSAVNLTTASLVALGGASITENVIIGGGLNMMGTSIENVGEPLNPSDVATKAYVDSQTGVDGNFTTGQVIIAASNGDAIRGYDNLTFDGASLVIASTEDVTGSVGGSVIAYGGVSVQKNVYIGGELDVNNNIIRNLHSPFAPTDAANKDYVDSKTFGNVSGSFGEFELVTGSSDANTLTSHSNLLFDGTTMSLGTSASLYISNTTPATGIGTGGSLTSLGGASFGKNVYIGGILDVSSNNITNVEEPINPSDAATKSYVDLQSLSGNFTTGQLLVGASNGKDIRGYDNIMYTDVDGTSGSIHLNDNTNLILTNTSNAIGLGSGGALIISGGASIKEDVYIGGKLDVAMNNIKHVANPVDSYDAVNKTYFDATFKKTFSDDNFLILDNGVTAPIDIADFVVTQDIRAFLSYVYVQYNQQSCAFFTLRGISRGDSWYLQKTYVGDSSNVDFFIRYENGSGILQYTNANLTGVASIRYNTLTEIKDAPNEKQINVDIASNVTSFQSIPELTLSNSEYDAAKIVLYVSNDSANKYGMVLLNCLLKGNEWVMTPHSFGNVTGLKFAILSGQTNGKIQYTNTNSVGPYTLRINIVPILKSQSSLPLQSNTNAFTDINSNKLVFNNSQSVFQMTAYVTIPDTNKHALYEFDGIHCDGLWLLNVRYIGDVTELRFALETFENFGTLRFINPNPVTAYIRYVLDAPLLFEPLPVKRGGSGQTYLPPNAVLRGNGMDPILASNDFVYKDLQLKLGPESTMLMTNTADASFATNGGVVIGGELRVKGVDMTPSVGDLFTEHVFLAANNATEEDIVGFSLTHPNVKSFNGTACITMRTLMTEYDAIFDIKALRRVSGWILQTSYFGDNLGVTFSITTNGQIQYTSSYVSDWIETKIKYRGLTTTI